LIERVNGKRLLAVVTTTAFRKPVVVAVTR